ncbi:MAG: TatA/E family twin arginine-targeting protein translocase [Thermoanaerobaculia bacterium]
MFGPIGMPELILIFVVALLVFGPKKLPEIGRSIGRGLAEFKKASDELKKTIEQEIEQGKAEVSSIRKEVGSVQDTVSGSAPARSSAPEETAPKPDSRPISPA